MQDRLLGLRKGVERNASRMVGEHQLRHALAGEGATAQAQLDVGDGQTVLVARWADFLLPHFGGHVDRGPGQAGRGDQPLVLLQPRDAEVAHLAVSLVQHQVLGLDIAVQDVLAVHVVDGLGRLTEVAEQLGHGKAGRLGARLGLTRAEAFCQSALGQLHDDDQAVGHQMGTVGGQQKRMTQFFDPLQGLLFPAPSSCSNGERMILRALGKPSDDSACQTSAKEPPPSKRTRR